MLVEQLPILSLSCQDLRDANTIALVDTSTYASLPTGGNYVLTCTPPGNYPTIALTFTPGSVNIYKCVDLGITCGDTNCAKLPDGIYEFVYTVVLPNTNVPATLDVKFIKIDEIKCAYQHAKMFIDFKCDCKNTEQDKLKQELRQVKLFIDGSVGACNDSNYVLSFDLYRKAEQMLNSLACKFGTRFSSGCGCGNPSPYNYSLGTTPCSTCH